MDYFSLRREIIYESRTVVVRTPSSNPQTAPIDDTDGLESIDGES